MANTLSQIVVSENREFVDVGPGVRLERLYKELKGYNLIVPGGTCPDVAIGGLSMGGTKMLEFAALY